MNCQVIGDIGSSSHASGPTKGSPENSVCGSSEVVSGWMYLNELGQMCGPYISQQLLEGLSSGFLPDELPVYPVMNGVTMAAVPLKLFKEYPDHVSTAFTSLSRSAFNASSSAIIHTSPMQDIHSDIQLNSNNQGLDQQTSYSSNMTISDSKVTSSMTVEQQQSLTWDNKCWSYLDGYGRVAGPYTLSELYYWHQYGYLPDSVMLRHVENKFSPSTLLSLLTAIRNHDLPSSAISGHGTSGSVEMISNVSEEIGSQLHNGIMKAARRLVLEEIIGDVVVDFVAGKKARKQVKIKQESNGFRNCFLEDKKIKVCAREKNGCVAPTDVVAYRDAATPEDISTKESSNNTKTIGGVENFQAAKTVISKRLFDYCSEVLWNAVFYDLVGNCALSWRNSRRWSYSCFKGMTDVAEESSNVVTISDAIGQVRELDSPDDELEFPPGFHHKQKDGSLSNDDREGTIARVQDDREATISLVREDNEGSIAKVQDDREETIARVQEQLFLASKASMVDCVKTCVKEEALKLYDCLKDKQVSEVSTEVMGQLSNVTDSGDPAPSELAQGFDIGHISLDDPPSQGMSSPHPLAPDEQFSISFLGNSFKRLGAPSGIAVDDQTMDEPPPPGLADVGMDISPQLLQMSFLNQFRTQQASVPLYKDCSAEFLGSAFKKLGKPICFSVDDQRTDEPPPPGSQGVSSNLVSSDNQKFQRLVLDVSMPKWRKFVILALFRQKLHDDVLKQWKSSFHDSLRCRLKQRDQLMEGTSVGNEQMANLTSALEHDLELLTERSKSCHDSGPSEVSVVEYTYSRRKMSKKFSAPVSSQDLQSSKCGKQSISKKSVCAEVDKHAADQIGLKVVESAPRTSKMGASVKGSLIKNSPPVRSSNPRKRQKVAGAPQAVAAKDHVKRAEKVAAAPVDSNVADDLASSSKVTIVDKVSTHRLQLKKNSPDISKLKRKCVMDESPSHQSKAAKLVKVDAKQASCKKVANGKTQTSKSRVMSSCPVSKGCARCSIDGWEWRQWSLNARPAERARVRGIKLTTMQHFGSDSNSLHPSHAKGISARTNRVKLRSLLAAAEGAEILKASQLKARKKRLRFQRSKIHDWGLVALEPIEAEDFVIEYVGELIRPRISDIREREYEKMGIGSSYLFRLDDGYVVDATKRGGIARFINHSCEPNCYTKTVTVDGQKRIFIYAKRHIASGQEITYNYKFPLEEKKIPCNCGAKRCRGSMN